MINVWIWTTLLLGILLLYLGAELLVLFASRLALSLGVTQLVTGLTVIAICTSAPELVSSLMALLKEQNSNMAFGNVIGSNIANLGLILGFLACIKPVKIPKRVLKVEAPLGVFLAAIVWLMMRSNPFKSYYGYFLVVCFVVYLVSQGLQAKKESHKQEHPLMDLSKKKKVLFFLWVCLGAMITVVGGYCFIEGASKLALEKGLSSRWVGLTLVAIGSSLPEFAASFVALIRKHPDLAIGNIYGSNIVNILFVLGIMASIQSFTFTERFLTFDAPALLVFSLAGWLLALRNQQLSRINGLLLVSLYGLYFVFLA